MSYQDLPKETEFSVNFLKEFGRIFRVNSDFGEKRTLSTLELTILENNLNNFLAWWKSVLEDNNLMKTLSEIEKVRVHIRNGCLS